MSVATKSVRIIGVGSPVSGDEAGLQLVARLRHEASWRARDDIEWLVLERPGATLLHYFDGVQTVCLIDALDSTEHRGAVRIDPDALLAGASAISSHHFGVAETLQLARALNQLPPRLLLYGIVPTADCYTELEAMLSRDLQV